MSNVSPGVPPPLNVKGVVNSWGIYKSNKPISRLATEVRESPGVYNSATQPHAIKESSRFSDGTARLLTLPSTPMGLQDPGLSYRADGQPITNSQMETIVSQMQNLPSDLIKMFNASAGSLIRDVLQTQAQMQKTLEGLGQDMSSQLHDCKQSIELIRVRLDDMQPQSARPSAVHELTHHHHGDEVAQKSDHNDVAEHEVTQKLDHNDVQHKDYFHPMEDYSAHGATAGTMVVENSGDSIDSQAQAATKIAAAPRTAILKQQHSIFAIFESSKEQVRELTLEVRYGNRRQWQRFLLRFVMSDMFKGIISLLVILNTVILGVEADNEIRAMFEHGHWQVPTWSGSVQSLCTLAFIIELVLRILAETDQFVFGQERFWNLFDTFLVVTAMLDDLARGVGATDLSFLRVLRIVRMFRATRILRVFRFLGELRIMIASIAASFVSLGWAFLLILILMFCASIMVCQGVSSYLANTDSTDQDLKADLHLHWGCIGTCMYTFLKALSGGGDWSSAVKPLETASPSVATAVVCVILFVVFGMMNVLTGVFVDRASDMSQMDRDLVVEAQRKKVEEISNALRKVFVELDTDGSGEMSLAEFLSYCNEEDVKAYMESMELGVYEAEELFRLLDKHSSGSVSIEDFINGCIRVKGQAKCMDLMSIRDATARTNKKLDDLGDQLNSFSGLITRARKSVQAAIDEHPANGVNFNG